MESQKRIVTLNCGDIEYYLTRKNVKNINLRINDERRISVSANDNVSIRQIEYFLKQKEKFILRALEKYSNYGDESKNWGLGIGKSIPLLGETYEILLVPSIFNRAYVDVDRMVIECKDPFDEKCLAIAVNNLYKKTVEEIVSKRFLRLRKYVLPKAEYDTTVKCRKMKTMWGNCRPKQNIVTLSSYLAAVPIDCIEYVMYHELVHFLYADHSRMFYHFLSIYCPYWSDARRTLKKYAKITNIL